MLVIVFNLQAQSLTEKISIKECGIPIRTKIEYVIEKRFLIL